MEGTSMILLVQKSGGFIVMIQFPCIPPETNSQFAPQKEHFIFHQFSGAKNLSFREQLVKTPVSHL